MNIRCLSRLHRLTTVGPLFFFLLIPFWGISQQDYMVAHFTDDNGLPQNSVKGLTSDPLGFVWMATENGLVRYDGRHFYVFDMDMLGISWNRFSPLRTSFAVAGPAGADSLPARRIYTRVADDQFVRIEDGIAALDTTYFTNVISKLPFFGKGADSATLSVGLPFLFAKDPDPAYHILGDSYGAGDMYVLGRNFIQFYKNGRKRYQIAARGNWSDYFLSRSTLFYLAPEGRLGEITPRGIRNVPVAGDLLREMDKPGLIPEAKLYWNGVADQVYLYVRNKLYLLTPGPDHQMHTKLVLENFDLEMHQIQSVYRDKSTQNLFLGSLSQGLFVLTRQIFQTLVPPEEIADNVFYALAEKDRHTLTTPDGIAIVQDSMTFKRRFRSLPLLRKINPADKRSVLYDHKSRLWVKVGEHLYLLDHDAKQIISQWDMGDEVKHIFQDQKKLIWIATAESGIYTLDPDAEQARPVKKHPEARATYFASAGNDVLAASTNGLYRFDGKTGKYRMLEATRGIFIKSLQVDRQGDIWLAANMGGLLLYRNNKLIRFPLDRNRYLASPHCIIDDGKGFFWIPTDKGLFQVLIRDLQDYAESPFPLYYQYHARNEGFRTNEFNGGCQPCGLRRPDGTVWLPSLVGLVWFDPNEIVANVPDKIIVLDKTRVNNRLVNILGDTLTLPADPVQAQFYFSTPYFGNEYNLDLSYALVTPGNPVKSSDWISIPGADFSITLSNLNHGTHYLLVRKVNGFGKGHYAIRRIVLVVPPLWYETWWAKILAVLLLCLCVFFYNRLRIKKIREENAKLEALIAMRTASLNKALSDIEDSKDEMARQVHMLSRLLTSMTHDIQSPLNYIRLTSGSIPGLVDRRDLDGVSEIGHLISDSSQRMGDLLRGLLDYIKVYVYGNRLQFQQVGLREIVNSRFAIFRNDVERNGNVFKNEVPEELTVLSDEQMLGIMIHNLLDNAAKFTSRGEIRVYVELAGDLLRLVILNTGRGISTDFLEFLNADRESSKDMLTPFGRNTGIGLLIVKEIAEMVQVALHVEQDEWTRFSLTFKIH